MRIAYVSTVGRGKQKEEASRVYKIDLDSGATLASVRLPLSMFDLANPRGGCRGGRGLAAFGTHTIFAAIFDGICELDAETLFIRECHWYGEPLQDARDIHQIYMREKGELLIVNTWTNSTNHVAVHSPDWKKWALSAPTDFSDVYAGKPAEECHIPLGCRDTLHLNSICDKQKYGLLCKVGAILDLETRKIIYEDNCLRGSHDLHWINHEEVAINLSRHCKTVAFNPITKEFRDLYVAPGGPDGEMAKHGWMRGMSYISKTDTLLLGSAPAQVVELRDVNTSPQARIISISDEIVESVFDVIPHPSCYE